MPRRWRRASTLTLTPTLTQASLEAEAECPSLATLEQRKKARLAEWKHNLSQVETERNSNFAPLGGGGDWRERVARARAAAASERADAS